jgi:TolB protein
MKRIIALAVMALALATSAETVVNISGVGAQKFTVSIQVANGAYSKCLAKNLEISGLFTVRSDGTIKVSGASGAMKAEGRGKVVSSAEVFSDDKSARMAARRFADAMCEAFGNQKGFALDRVLFLNRGKSSGRGQVRPSEMCVSYPDGYDVRQLTSDGRMTIFQRWKDRDSVIYISDLKGAPQVWELNTATGKRNPKWSFKGSPDGIAVSPDGTKVAAILSVHGNPELYVISGDRFARLTNTPLASEGQPVWSPDGKKIAYVSNEARNPQIYVVDVATKTKRRLTSKGRENVDPDWGPDGRIAYITKRGGAQVAVMSPAEGDATAELVTPEGNWEHPSWSRDMRHLVASRDKALFIIDTLKDGDKPRQLFGADGNFISPVWQR